ncbi:taste receptor type 2 member 40-like [Dendropsophus ebraccatus]|uniref:taste receptor type 2 member 40-like n=1 Tax=Dendropsophus ebraccatus TaxID=150705 RepID=UPI003831C7D6
MISALRMFRLALMILSGVFGTLLNFSIVVVYFDLWRKVGDGCRYNVILLIIGLVNLSYQCCLTIDNVFKFSQIYELFDKKFCLLLFSLQFALIGLSLWNTVWLSILYCVRLVNSSQWLFLRIKEKFFCFLPQLMVGSVLWSISIALPIFWETSMETPQNNTDYMTICSYNMNVYYIIPSLLLGVAIPVSITCFSIGLSVRTLVRHIFSMRNSHITSPQLQGHFQAVRTLSVRVFLEIVFFIVIVMVTFTSLRSNPTMEAICWVNIMIYPTSQALILVFGNPTLKKKLCDCLMIWKRL